MRMTYNCNLQSDMQLILPEDKYIRTSSAEKSLALRYTYISRGPLNLTFYSKQETHETLKASLWFTKKGFVISVSMEASMDELRHPNDSEQLQNTVRSMSIHPEVHISSHDKPIVRIKPSMLVRVLSSFFLNFCYHLLNQILRDKNRGEESQNLVRSASIDPNIVFSRKEKPIVRINLVPITTFPTSCRLQTLPPKIKWTIRSQSRQLHP
ncbi:hypothetical protein ACET3Z_025916 [Daucus carota]